MAERKKLMFVLGTRPEVIKMAPIIKRARAMADSFETVVVSTSQHRQMLDQMLNTFDLKIDVDLDIMKHDQSIADVTVGAINGLYPVMEEIKPDVVIVQGDTTTTFSGALCAFYHKISVAHVEAGLRSFDKYQPYPEEVNRKMVSQIADVNFVPTKLSRQNLINEGIGDERIWVTGNTCIDSLLWMIEKSDPGESEKKGRSILVTAHRRENHGNPMKSICRAIIRLAEEYRDITFIYPLHLSPRVRKVAVNILEGYENINLIEPLEYSEFVKAMNDSFLILTDSGGVQEEAPLINKPVLVLREVTERPEGLDAGTLKLVGTDENRIYDEVKRLLDDPEEYDRMASAPNPYGDGHASERILDVLKNL